MKTELDTLLNELKRLKKEGVSSLLLESDTLDLLEAKVTAESKAAKARANTTPATANEPSQAASEPPPKTNPPVAAPVEKPAPIAEKKDYHTLPQFNLPDGTKPEQWEWLKKRVLECPVCNNHVKPGKKVIMGSGNLDSDIFFCGEAPGAEEEIKGEVFVGPAGQLLTKIIQAMGLKREQVYIGNIMNWRPETDTPYGNRPPNEDEMAFCLPYLKAQLEIVKPKVIVALGATAVNGLLGHDPRRSITRSHGQWQEFESIPTLISFHPSYVLRNGTIKVKRMIWEDMLAVMEYLEMPVSDKQRGFFQS